MDALNHYRNIIEKILTEYGQMSYAEGDVRRQVVADHEGDHYLLMLVGWDDRRVHGSLIHVDIINGKFWIQRDGTEYGIARELEDAGVPKHDIVLAFKSPELRQYTGYAVA